VGVVTGTEIKRLREKLGMNIHEWAQLLGCSGSTTYRWESTKGPVEIDLLQRKFLVMIKDLSVDMSLQSLGRELMHAVQTRGGLYGLWLLLEFYYRDR